VQALAQTIPASQNTPPAQTVPSASTSAQPSPAIGALTLTDAIGRSQTANTAYAQAVADSKVADAQIGVARSALLPGVVYHNQYLYTQPQHVGGKPAASGSSSPLFIANNAVHEYVSQGAVTETLSGALLTDLRRTEAGAAVAKAKLEVARRGLVASVVIAWYGALADEAKIATAQQALDQARHFATISAQLEAGGEVAHADVIKANLQVQQRQRDLDEARLQAERSRIDLAILLFPNPLTPYTLSGSLTGIPVLPPRGAIDAAANHDNPDIKAALAAFKAAQLEVTSAKLDYLPALIFNYSYGIDATQFAITGSDGSRNLGYQAFVTLDIPVWDWFATRNKIRQSVARKDLAQTELTATQRQLAASIEELYREAQVAYDATKSLDLSVQDATTALHLSELRYQNGEAPILEIVDAQTTLITTQNSRIDSAARLKSALANLQTLTGNLP
jgi:outer membrane protein TolC